MNVYSRAILVALVAMLLGPAALAQPNGPVQSRLEQAKVALAADGREALVPAGSAKPGEVIQYTASYRNNGTSPVRDLAATLPIPAETELLPGSERPSGAWGSLDGVDFGLLPLKRKKRVQGKDVVETVPMREVRYLRWNATALAPGETATFVARVRVLDDAPPRAGPGGRP